MRVVNQKRFFDTGQVSLVVKSAYRWLSWLSKRCRSVLSWLALGKRNLEFRRGNNLQETAPTDVLLEWRPPANQGYVVGIASGGRTRNGARNQQGSCYFGSDDNSRAMQRWLGIDLACASRVDFANDGVQDAFRTSEE
jgi:hypothetical protein